MNDAVSNAYRVLVGPEEIFVDFGQTAPPGSSGDITIALTHRIVMPPRVASRLVSLLLESVGSTEPEPEVVMPPEPAPSDLEPLLHPTRSLHSSRAEPPSAAAAAGLLFRLVSELGVVFAHERSFRMRTGSLLANRYLLSVRRRQLGDEAEAKLFEIARAFEMPPELQGLAARFAPDATAFHFGFEEDEGVSRYKVYLESGAALAAGREAKPGAPPVRLHLAMKWDVAGAVAPVVTEYHWYPALDATGILDRIAAVHGSGMRADDETFRIVNEILILATQRMPEHDIQYLEVVEGNKRRSYDLNFYDADLELRDLLPLLSRMRRLFDVPAGRFQALYDQIKSRSFGHLAGGVHRGGEAFFTIYYGVEGRVAEEAPDAERS